MKPQVAASEFPIPAEPQRELETSIQPLKRPTANHLCVILKSSAETRFKNFRVFQHYLRLTEHFSESLVAP